MESTQGTVLRKCLRKTAGRMWLKNAASYSLPALRRARTLVRATSPNISEWFRETNGARAMMSSGFVPIVTHVASTSGIALIALRRFWRAVFFPRIIAATNRKRYFRGCSPRRAIWPLFRTAQAELLLARPRILRALLRFFMVKNERKNSISGGSSARASTSTTPYTARLRTAAPTH